MVLLDIVVQVLVAVIALLVLAIIANEIYLKRQKDKLTRPRTPASSGAGAHPAAGPEPARQAPQNNGPLRIESAAPASAQDAPPTVEPSKPREANPTGDKPDASLGSLPTGTSVQNVVSFVGLSSVTAAEQSSTTDAAQPAQNPNAGAAASGQNVRAGPNGPAGQDTASGQIVVNPAHEERVVDTMIDVPRKES